MRSEGPCAGNETGETGAGGEAKGSGAVGEAAGAGAGSETGDIGAGDEAKGAGAGNEIYRTACGVQEDRALECAGNDHCETTKRMVVFSRHGRLVSTTLL